VKGSFIIIPPAVANKTYRRLATAKKNEETHESQNRSSRFGNKRNPEEVLRIQNSIIIIRAGK
jgi:hypothetical protein